MLVHQKIYRNLTLVCTLIIFSFYWNVAEAQEKKSQLISVSFTNTPLIELVKQLKTKSSAHIYYQPEWLTGVVFTGSFSDKNMDDILEKVLDETGLVSITINNNFYIIPREQVAVHLKKMNNLFGGSNQELVKDFTLIGSPGDIGKYSKNRISGIVLDGKNGESLVGSTVQVLNTSIYGVSGSRGNYYFEVPSGTYQIKVTSVGYEVQLLTIKVLGPGTLNIEMFEESHAINEVVILSEKVDRNVTRDQMSMVELDAKSIKNLPSMIGERDLIKSFTIMPGVKSVGEFGAGINVRGGGEDQNLYLLENSPLFNTSHVMGLLSAVNPDAVTSVALYKGHIPPEYGERVSSVMDINFNGREVKKFKGTGGIGIYSSRLMFEVPLYKNIVSLKLGGRTSYSEYLLTKMPDYNLQNSSASFYDLNGMLSINIKNNPISLFVYRSYDYFKYANNFSYQYGNQLLSANWQHIFNPSFNTTLSGSYSSYSLTNKKEEKPTTAQVVYSKVNYLSGKLLAEYTGLSEQTVTAGAQILQYQINPGERVPIGQSKVEQLTLQKELGYEYSFFINDVVKISNHFSFQAGLRYTMYRYMGPQTIYTYSASGATTVVTDTTNYNSGEMVTNYQGIEPRASFKYLINPSSSVKLSYNRNKQYLALLSYTSITTPEDIWKLADPFIKPIIVDQVALGYYRNFLNNGIETSVELYYKKLQNLTEYRNGAELELNSHVETELLTASGKNYGLEMMVKKTQGKLTGSISYTYARAFKQTHGANFTDRINNNRVYPSQYDVPHDINLSFSYQLNRRIRFGSSFTFASGRPVTLPEYTYYLGQSKLVYYSDRNKYRLPDYHRLDISLSIDESLKKKKKWKGSWNFSILNIYGRDNAYSIIYQRDTPTPDNNYQVFSMYQMYLIGVPFPTVTYNFVF